MSSPGRDCGVTGCCDVLGRAALVSAAGLARHKMLQALSDIGTPKPATSSFLLPLL